MSTALHPEGVGPGLTISLTSYNDKIHTVHHDENLAKGITSVISTSACGCVRGSAGGNALSGRVCVCLGVLVFLPASFSLPFTRRLSGFIYTNALL